VKWIWERRKGLNRHNRLRDNSCKQEGFSKKSEFLRLRGKPTQPSVRLDPTPKNKKLTLIARSNYKHMGPRSQKKIRGTTKNTSPKNKHKTTTPTAPTGRQNTAKETDPHLTAQHQYNAHPPHKETVQDAGWGRESRLRVKSPFRC